MSSEVEIEKLLNTRFKSKRSFRANEIIFKEGEKIKGIYFINNGKIKVTRRGKKNMVVWFAYSNEFIGLSSFFSDSEYYSFSSSAFGGKVHSTFIPTNEFKKILNNNSIFNGEIILALCNRIGYTRNRIYNLKSQKIKQRLLNTILLLINEKNTNGAKVKIHYSNRELSELVGTSTQYIQRLMAEFQEKKLLEIKGDSMIVDKYNLYLKIT